MVEYLKGKIAELSPTHVVLEVQGGLAFFLSITISSYEALQNKQDAFLYVHLVVKEDGMSLYGFSTKEEREMFRLLISVSGVGPNIARVILSSIPYQQLAQAIVQQDIHLLKKTKGIGQKTAERIVLELKDKVTLQGAATTTQFFVHNNFVEEALLAMMQLGFPKLQAEKAISKALEHLKGETLTTETILRYALKYA